MKIFIIIVSVAFAAIAGWFFRITWENYHEEEIVLTTRWFNIIPTTVIQPFFFGVFCIFMVIFILTTVI